MNILVSEMDNNYKFFDTLDLSGTNILYYINVDNNKINENEPLQGEN